MASNADLDRIVYAFLRKNNYDVREAVAGAGAPGARRLCEGTWVGGAARNSSEDAPFGFRRHSPLGSRHSRAARVMRDVTRLYRNLGGNAPPER